MEHDPPLTHDQPLFVRMKAQVILPLFMAHTGYERVHLESKPVQAAAGWCWLVWSAAAEMAPIR